MRICFIVLALLLLPATLLAQQPMNPAEFEEYTKGKTLFFAANGTRYGAEQYLSNRRVRWSYLDGHCKEGYWYEDTGDICFVYEDNPTPQCWHFFDEADGLRAKFISTPDARELYEIQPAGEEMLCLGPEIGV